MKSISEWNTQKEKKKKESIFSFAAIPSIVVHFGVVSKRVWSKLSLEPHTVKA